MTRADFNHLLSTIKALPPEQMRQLRQQLDQMPDAPTPGPKQSPAKAAKRARPAAPKTKPLTADELNRRLLAEGRLASLPDPALDLDDDDPDDQPIAIEGEPLSETILRERR
jgi:hypothetical protein